MSSKSAKKRKLLEEQTYSGDIPDWLIEKVRKHDKYLKDNIEAERSKAIKRTVDTGFQES